MRFVWNLCMVGALLACNVDQAISGPVSITGEWTLIEPPEPLRTKGRLAQRICLKIDAVQDVDYETGMVVLGNGQRQLLAGEAIDSSQTKYTLKLGSLGEYVCLSRAGERRAGPDFPQPLVRLRLRTDPPLHVEEIRWRSYDPM